MKFYLASGLHNKNRAQLVRNHLQAAGHQPSYDWTTHGAIGHLGQEALVATSFAELTGVRNADVVIVLLPGARGTHAELGAALALGKPVIIWDETRTAFPIDNSTCAFYWHPLVHRFEGDVELGIETLIATAEGLTASRVPA